MQSVDSIWQALSFNNDPQNAGVVLALLGGAAAAVAEARSHS